MITRAKHGIVKPMERLNLLVTHPKIPPIPKTYRVPISDPHWRQYMADEYTTLIDNHTWSLVPLPPGTHVVTGKWILKHKLHFDGSLAHHKARWVVRGYSQKASVDFDETFSHVIKPSTIRMVLIIIVSLSCPIHQLDVKNGFLHGTIDETGYCQPTKLAIASSSPISLIPHGRIMFVTFTNHCMI